jgi:hypothetical protein
MISVNMHAIRNWNLFLAKVEAAMPAEAQIPLTAARWYYL